MDRKVIMKGVDLSHWNRSVDMKALSDTVDFVILKVGGEEGDAGKFRLDKTFYTRYEQAKEAGLHVGGYFFMSTKPCVFKTYPDYICGQLEKALDGLYLDMPLYIDVEGQPIGYKNELTTYVYRWCEKMELEYNYYVGIYGSDISTFHDLLDIERLNRFDKWVARYGTEPKYVKQYNMWQYSSKGEVIGVGGKCDLNYAFIDFPSIIEKKGLNR